MGWGLARFEVLQLILTHVISGEARRRLRQLHAGGDAVGPLLQRNSELQPVDSDQRHRRQLADRQQSRPAGQHELRL